MSFKFLALFNNAWNGKDKELSRNMEGTAYFDNMRLGFSGDLSENVVGFRYAIISESSIPIVNEFLSINVEREKVAEVCFFVRDGVTGFAVGWEEEAPFVFDCWSAIIPPPLIFLP